MFITVNSFFRFLFVWLFLAGVPVAHWVKHALAYWSSGPEVESRSRRTLLNRNRGSIAHTFQYHPHIVPIYLKYCWKGRKISSRPSIYFLGCPRDVIVSTTTVWPTQMRVILYDHLIYLYLVVFFVFFYQAIRHLHECPRRKSHLCWRNFSQGSA